MSFCISILGEYSVFDFLLNSFHTKLNNHVYTYPPCYLKSQYFLIFAIITCFCACTKASLEQYDSDIELNLEERLEYLDKDKQIIESFIQRVKDKSLGSEKSAYSKESAEWHIETALNLLHTDLEETNFSVGWSEFSYELPKVNEELSSQTVQDIFYQLEWALEMEIGSQGLVASDVVINEKPDDYNLWQVKMYIGKVESVNTEVFGATYPYFCEGFGSNHFWTAFNNSVGQSPYSGICDGPLQGQETGIGGAEAMQMVVNSCPQRPRDIYTEVETIYVNPQAYDYEANFTNPQDPTSGDGYLDFYAISRGQIGTAYCMSPEEMNFYAFTGFPEIIDLVRPLDSENEPKRFVRLADVSWDFGCNQENECVVAHTLEIVYAAQ